MGVGKGLRRMVDYHKNATAVPGGERQERIGWFGSEAGRRGLQGTENPQAKPDWASNPAGVGSRDMIVRRAAR